MRSGQRAWAVHVSRISSLRLLLPFLRPYLGRAAGAAVALLLAAGLTLAVGQGLRHIIDDGFSGGVEALNRSVAETVGRNRASKRPKVALPAAGKVGSVRTEPPLAGYRLGPVGFVRVPSVVRPRRA